MAGRGAPPPVGWPKPPIHRQPKPLAAKPLTMGPGAEVYLFRPKGLSSEGPGLKAPAKAFGGKIIFGGKKKRNFKKVYFKKRPLEFVKRGGILPEVGRGQLRAQNHFIFHKKIKRLGGPFLFLSQPTKGGRHQLAVLFLKPQGAPGGGNRRFLGKSPNLPFLISQAQKKKVEVRWKNVPQKQGGPNFGARAGSQPLKPLIFPWD